MRPKTAAAAAAAVGAAARVFGVLTLILALWTTTISGKQQSKATCSSSHPFESLRIAMQ